MADERTSLAVERTALAHERTLNAWVRTATSLISFGFTIYKMFDYLTERGRPIHTGWLDPRRFGGSMISIGLVALILAIAQHIRSRATLKDRGYPVQRSLALIIAVLIATLGVLGLGFVIFNR